VTSSQASQNERDGEILRGLAAAKPEAFHRFFEEWFPRVYAFAERRLASRPHAECVTARALRRALAEAPRLDPATPIAPWLLEHLRREIRWAERAGPP